MKFLKKTQRIAIGGLLTAFSTVMIILAGIVPSGTFTFPAAAGIIIGILSFTAGKSYAWASFFIVALLSFVICPNKEASLCFTLFLGFYPLAKELIEKLRLKPVQYVIKLLLFNASAVTIYFLLLFVFSMPEDSFEFFGISVPGLFLLALNVVFLIYDLAITMFLMVYKEKINKFVTKINKRF